MKKHLKKFGKGYFAIFLIKVILFSGSFLVQSCQSSDDETILDIEKQDAYDELEKNLNKANTINSNTFKKFQNKSGDLTQQQVDVLADSSSELAVQQALAPVMVSSKNLFALYGVSEFDLATIFGDANDPRIAILGTIVAEVEREYNQAPVGLSLSFQDLLVNKLHAQSGGPNPWVCAGQAFGINTIAQLFAGVVSRSAILGAARVIASRLLGWVGVGLAIYYFGKCMDYWSESPIGDSSQNLDDYINISIPSLDKTYILLKSDINYVSNSEYEFRQYGSYAIYEINEGFNGICEIKVKSQTIGGGMFINRNLFFSPITGCSILEDIGLNGGGPLGNRLIGNGSVGRFDLGSN
ncbi:hypothetical protein [Aquimarina sp. MMG016]|uniref:hypothetical protein n=1 Tax=Aquimarina sp. MMG016 TaxID=2822690 RepID=UPI001B3A7B59|nr:hypothetical protein [Aquimarina sp. MMG016]MBQ4821827.1 hypothetical protein [Aquimarina sp. MMG016]